jgi:hypothetical protein
VGCPAGASHDREALREKVAEHPIGDRFSNMGVARFAHALPNGFLDVLAGCHFCLPADTGVSPSAFNGGLGAIGTARERRQLAAVWINPPIEEIANPEIIIPGPLNTPPLMSQSH